MDKTKEMPILFSSRRKVDINRTAVCIARAFTESIYPILQNFGLLDDVHVKKYLGIQTTEEIYKDALSENPEIISKLETTYRFTKVDVWKGIRDTNSPVESPKDEGFIFAPMPGADAFYFSKAIKALVVKDGNIEIDTNILTEESIVKPTDKQKELYAIIADLCDALNEKKYDSINLNAMVAMTKEGFKPSISGIMGDTFISIKK